MSNRYEELDSLRGLAALSVFFSHIYLIFNETLLSKLLFEYGLLRGMVAGSEAVTLFFVLSGFVLSIPFYSNKDFNYGEFAVKRFCRIYIPYIVAIVITFIFREIFYTGKIHGLTDWFNVNWSVSLNANAIIDHLLLLGTFTSNLNNVVWSLVHEMRISLMFPFIMFLLIKLNMKQGIGLAFTLSVMSILFSLTADNPFLGTELYYSVHLTSLFIVGALLAKFRYDIINYLLNLKFKSKMFIFILGLILYLYAHPSFVLNILIRDFNPFYRAVIDTWITSIGAAILIIFALSSVRFSKILKNKLVNYLGKISYSLYLYHLAVLFTFIHLFYNIMPLWVICLISIIGTFIISSCMYHLIEKPAIKIGKLLTKNTNSKNIGKSSSDRPINIS
ncbi:acyltransferase family protein [Metabacillus sediminilitoris]|uniref:acyltransferase family protein n=1 Tax=Metabacillus sediminilitoris TaxID=2567941 RepID=UPI001454D4A3|nr:acyltransferase [Metabacillus sediminilitoris]